MRNFYLKMKTIGAALLVMFAFQNSFSQVDLTWLGTTSGDALETTNWDPQSGIEGNNLNIGNDTTWTYECTISSDVNIGVHRINTAGPVIEAGVITHGGGVCNINMGTGAQLLVSYGDSYYHHGTLNILGGNYRFGDNKNFYMEDSTCYVNIDCDTASFRNLIALGDRNGTRGGFLNISGHSLVICENDFIRVASSVPGQSILYITEDAEFRVNGKNYVSAFTDYIASGHLVTDPDRDVVVVFDVINNRTVVTTRLKTAFVIEPIDRQILIAGEAGDSVYVIQNDGYASMVSTEWVYGTTSGGPYSTSFTPAETNPYIKPNFSESGDFYLVLKGIDGSAATHYTNEVNCLVASNKAIVTPDVAQTIRLGQAAQMLTVTETPAGTSRQWKYSTEPGGPYTAFSPDVTGTEFNANFTEVGNYFVVCESMIDGKLERSKEVQFTYTDANSAALNLVFNGSVSNDAGNMFNWDPAAYINKNNLKIPEGMTAVLSTASNDTVYNFEILLGGVFEVNKPSNNDTLFYIKDHLSSAGSFVVSGGVFVKTANYFRLYDLNTTFTVTNDAVAILNGQVLLGGSNNPANGSNLIIQDNAVMSFENVPGRISANEGYSEFRLSGNARYEFAGDVRGSIAPLITGTPLYAGTDSATYSFFPKFITPDGYEPFMYYDPANGKTVVVARDLSAFAVEQTMTQIVGPGQATNDISLINSSAYTSFEWVYSPYANGPWTAFDPAITGETTSVSFATPDTIIYVACRADGAVMTSNSVPVKVVNIAVTPAATQYIEAGADGTELSYTLPADATGIQWKYATTSGGPYNEFNPQELNATYLPWGDDFTGDHFIVYEATVLGDDGLPVTVYSNEVAIVVWPTGLANKSIKALNVYTSDGSVNIKGVSDAYMVQVIDAKGALVSAKKVNGGDTSVAINSKGVYLIKIVSGNSMKVERVVIK